MRLEPGGEFRKVVRLGAGRGNEFVERGVRAFRGFPEGDLPLLLMVLLVAGRGRYVADEPKMLQALAEQQARGGPSDGRVVNGDLDVGRRRVGHREAGVDIDDRNPMRAVPQEVLDGHPVSDCGVDAFAVRQFI